MYWIWLIIYSSIGWAFLFLLVSLSVSFPLPRKDLWDLRNRVVSFIHGLYCIWFSTTEICRGTEFGSPNNEFQTYSVSISLGYFLYDTLCMLILGIYDRPIMFHHTFVFLGVLSGLLTGSGGIEMTYGYFVAEFTNPFLHIKECLRAAGQKNTFSYFSMEAAYIAAFYFSRFLIGLPVTYMIWFSYQVIIYERVACVLLELMFCYWGMKMWSISKKRFKEYKERREKGVKLPWIVDFKERLD